MPCYHPAVRTRVLLTLLTLACVPALACGAPPDAAPAKKAEPEPAPEPAPEPDPAPKPEPAVEPPPAPEPDPDPVMAERKQALANVGRSAFDALKAGKLEDLLALTPRVDPYLQQVCPSMGLADERELAARFSHCHDTIDWDAVAEAQAFATKPTGEPASGCAEGIEDYGRMQLFVHMQDSSIWRVEFYGAVGQDGKAIGLSGEVRCSPAESAPSL